SSTQTLQASQRLSSQTTSPSTFPDSAVNGVCFTSIAGHTAPQMPQSVHFSSSTLKVILLLSASCLSFVPSFSPSYSGTSLTMASRGHTSSQMVHRTHFSSSMSATISYCGNPSFS